MSDLLPLALATIRDKAVVDAKDELDGLQKRLTRVEIIRRPKNIYNIKDEDEAVVYASGHFDKGKYYGTSKDWWRVDLPTKGTKACKLSDLYRCDICVGGGFPFASIEKNRNDLMSVAKFVGDCPVIIVRLSDWGRETRIRLCVHGCGPRKTWWPVVCQSCPIDYLAEHIAPHYPNATIEFVSVRFLIGAMHGAFKRLLTPKRREEAEEEAREREKRKKPSPHFSNICGEDIGIYIAPSWEFEAIFGSERNENG